MDVTQLFDGLTTHDSILIFSALGIAYLLGIFSMEGYMYSLRQKMRKFRADNVLLKNELAEVKSQLIEQSQPSMNVDLLRESPMQEYMNEEKERFSLLQREFNSFKSEFQDSIEFYVHSIEELTESNHTLARKVKALELENEQLVKAVWSDDLSFQSFTEDLNGYSVSKKQETATQQNATKEIQAQEATNNIKKWVNTQKKKNYSRDNLTEIKGISKAIEEKINEIGIISYRQLSLLDDALIEDLATAIRYYAGRIKNEDWVGQAYHLVKKQNS